MNWRGVSAFQTLEPRVKFNRRSVVVTRADDLWQPYIDKHHSIRIPYTYMHARDMIGARAVFVMRLHSKHIHVCAKTDSVTLKAAEWLVAEWLRLRLQESSHVPSPPLARYPRARELWRSAESYVHLAHSQRGMLWPIAALVERPWRAKWV